VKVGTLVAGVLVGAAAVGIYVWSRPAQARFPMPAGPLRPPPPPPKAEPPGPLARKFSTFIGGLSDAELVNLRGSIPLHWWDRFVTATTMPTDDLVVIALNPARIDYAAMTDAQREALSDGLMSSVGLLRALELRGLLQEAKVM